MSSENEIFTISRIHWLCDDIKFSENLVSKIYQEQILRYGFAHKQIQALEFTQYLEKYLWPNFKANSFKCEREFIISICAIVNEKISEKVNPWDSFISKHESFEFFFQRVLELILETDAQSSKRWLEHIVLIQFLNNCFLSMTEVELIFNEIKYLMSLGMWSALSNGRLNEELTKNREYKHKYGKLLKSDDRVKFKRTFLPSLLGIFLAIVEDESVDDVLALRFAENCVVLLINLESMLVSRRYFNAIVDDKRVVVRLQNAVLLKNHEDTRLFTQLVDMLDLYAHFEIDEVTGSTLTDSELECRHREKLVKLQQQAFVKFKEPMQELWLSTCRALETGDTLRGLLTNQSRDDLQLLATAMGLVDSEHNKEHLLDMFCYAYKRRCSTLNRLNNLPLYPTERLIYDENQIPDGQFSLEDNFAIPKLSVQYLSFHDYLMRNFELFRLEASYEIKQDIERCLGMMRPVMGENGDVLFQGWSRMALAIDNFEIVEVGKPEIGRGYPRVVKADVSVVLGSGKDVVRAEWDGMARHDPCFLITVIPQLSINDSGRYNNKETMAAQMRSLTVRGCEIEGLVDKEGKVITEEERRHKVQSIEGQGRTWRVRLDPCQYQYDVIDDNSDTKDLYGTFNILMRRRPKENNFKAVLETIRDLMNDHCVVPNWLQDLLLGYDQPCNAHYSAMTATYIRSQNWSDTFLSLDHVTDSFPQYSIVTDVANDTLPPYKITFPDPTVDSALQPITMHTPPNQPITTQETSNQPITTQETSNQPITTQETSSQPITKPALLVNSYREPIKLAQRYTDPSRWTQFHRLPTTPISVQGNQIRFTATQVEAIRSGMQHGLTVVVGPPGTGKTDIAVQIISNLYHNYPNQRTLIVTHSNQALNQLFEKIMHLDIDERHLLRLGHGEEALETSKDFSKYGRVNYVLAKRLQLLREVERLSLCLGCITAVSVSDQPLYTCETAQHFLLAEVMPRWMTFLSECTAPNTVANTFPFVDFFIPKQFQSDASLGQLFPGLGHEDDLETAKACFKHLLDMFVQLDDFRSFELMRNGLSRANSLLVQHAKIIAMTCTHAALRRRDLIQLGFSYDNILIEEAAQILEIETFIPLLLQKPDQSNLNRLKRWVMIGDHNQLPPVIKNTVFQNYCNMSQSMFARLVKLGVPAVQLNAQGRSRTDIVSLYGWRYKSLADLPIIEQGREYAAANPGLVFDYQLINVPDYLGRGESEPTPHFIQNLAEAEYCVAMYMYMRAIGYPADKITILTTYNGQKHLIRDVIRNRCGDTVSPPHKVTTVDRFQGQQNDYVLLSLVRTKTVGHLRDIRRLVVALSRARLGLYVFCRTSLFGQCRELQQSFGILMQRPTDLALVTGEHYSQLTGYMSGDYAKIRMADERPDQSAVSFIQDVRHMTNYVHTIYATFKHNAMTTTNNKRVLEVQDEDEPEQETPAKLTKMEEEPNEEARDLVNIEEDEEVTSEYQLKLEEETKEDKVDGSINIAQDAEETNVENK